MRNTQVKSAVAPLLWGGEVLTGICMMVYSGLKRQHEQPALASSGYSKRRKEKDTGKRMSQERVEGSKAGRARRGGVGEGRGGGHGEGVYS